MTAQNDATRTPSSRELAEQDQKRHAEVEAQLHGHALAAARRDVVINMYSTSWCGACAKAVRNAETASSNCPWARSFSPLL